MYRSLGLVILFLAAALLVPTEAIGQNKKKKQKNDPTPMATPQEYAQLAQLKDVVGKLVYAETSAQSLTLRLDFQHIEANPNFKPAGGKTHNLNQQMQRILNDQARLQNERNPLRRQQLMRQLIQDTNRLQQQLAGGATAGKANPNNLPYRIVTDSKDFHLDVEDKATVRWQTPPFKYDDKGEVVKYTKEQLEELRGKDKSKPGYEGKFDDLMPGQTVKLYLKAPERKSGKEKDEDAAVNRPKVTMILILQDSTNLMFGQGQERDKKKKKK